MTIERLLYLLYSTASGFARKIDSIFTVDLVEIVL